MAAPTVSVVEIKTPIIAFGKHFVGDYGQSQQYTMEVLDKLTKDGIEFQPNKVFGVYYDDPMSIKPEETRSFHAFFPESHTSQVPDGLEKFSFSGKYLKVEVQGDPHQSIMLGYEALFRHIKEQNFQLASNAGFQITSFDNGVMTTEIYMQLS